MSEQTEVQHRAIPGMYLVIFTDTFAGDEVLFDKPSWKDVEVYLHQFRGDTEVYGGMATVRVYDDQGNLVHREVACDER